jgi:hypothetical protein
MDVGLKVTVTPVGWPVAVSAIAELKPPGDCGGDCGSAAAALEYGDGSRRCGNCERWGCAGAPRERIDQTYAVRTAPASHQIVAYLS